MNAIVLWCPVGIGYRAPTVTKSGSLYEGTWCFHIGSYILLCLLQVTHNTEYSKTLRKQSDCIVWGTTWKKSVLVSADTLWSIFSSYSWLNLCLWYLQIRRAPTLRCLLQFPAWKANFQALSFCRDSRLSPSLCSLIPRSVSPALLTRPSQLDQDGQKAGWLVLWEALLCQAGLMMANKLAAATANDSSTGNLSPSLRGPWEKSQKWVECFSKHKDRHYPECTGQQRGALIDYDRRGYGSGSSGDLQRGAVRALEGGICRKERASLWGAGAVLLPTWGCLSKAWMYPCSWVLSHVLISSPPITT